MSSTIEAAMLSSLRQTQPVPVFVSQLPWSSSAIENRRFGQITLVVLVLTLLLAALVKWQELPERPRAEKEKVPPQLTRIVKPVKVEPPKPLEPPKPVVIPEPEVKKPEPERKPPPPVNTPEVTKKTPEPVKESAEAAEPEPETEPVKKSAWRGFRLRKKSKEEDE